MASVSDTNVKLQEEVFKISMLVFVAKIARNVSFNQTKIKKIKTKLHTIWLIYEISTVMVSVCFISRSLFVSCFVVLINCINFCGHTRLLDWSHAYWHIHIYSLHILLWFILIIES